MLRLAAYGNIFTGRWRMKDFRSVDIRDFESDGRKKDLLVREIGAAIRTDGFFCVEGHGIHQEEIAMAYRCSKQLFGLEPEVLLRYAYPHKQAGYIGMYEEQAAGAEVPDEKHFWHVWQPNPSRELLTVYDNPWPTEVFGIKAVLLSIFYQQQEVTFRVLRAVALSLGLPEWSLVSMVAGGPSVSRHIEYPPLVDDAKGVRAAEHEDINFITGLLTSDGEGLEVLGQDGEWRPVNNSPEQMVFNAADMLTELTHGLVRSVKHRVINPTDPAKRRVARRSMPFFCHPQDGVVLNPASDKVAGKSQLTAAMFLHLRLWEIHLRDDRPAWYVGPDRKPKPGHLAA